MDKRTQGIRTTTFALSATAAMALVALPAGPASAEEDRYTVVAGDTVWDLAKRYGSTVNAIVTANNLGSRALIMPGQQLVIPAQGTGNSPASTVATSVSHAVVAGDTVWALARRYGSTVDGIVAANELGANALIRIGDVLTIPGATAPAGSTAPVVANATNISQFGAVGTTYTVRSGDTLSAIAKRYGTTVDAIAKNNSISDPSLIRIGQILALPGGTPAGLVGDSFLGRTYPEGVVAAANQNKATLNAMDVPTRSQMQQLVVSIAQSMGVDPVLAQAVAYQESGFNQRAVSPANAIGCMQVIPSSGEWASDIVGRELNLLVPEDNVTAGVAILMALQSNGTPLDTAIAGYYQGATSVKKNGMHADTVTYVASVKSLMERFD